MERKRICNMDPIDFEKACLEILKGYAEEEQLKDFEITHNKIIKSSDGKYQIDIFPHVQQANKVDTRRIQPHHRRSYPKQPR